MRKTSKKREAILEILRSTKEHPNAEWIHTQMKKEYPDISLATVYRNLAMFKDDGTIISLGSINGQERYDADISPHSHFICVNCGKILDLYYIPLKNGTLEKIEKDMNVHVLNSVTILSGLCSECYNQQK